MREEPGREAHQKPSVPISVFLATIFIIKIARMPDLYVLLLFLDSKCTAQLTESLLIDKQGTGIK